MRHPLPAVLALCLLLLALAGCTSPRTPAESMQRENRPAATPAGVYLASLTVMDVNTDYGIAVAFEPQIATFPAGDVQFVVMNKWLGLSPGAHSERIRVLAPDGSTELYTEATEFEVAPERLAMTVVEPVVLQAAPAGKYWIAVELDGKEVSRYPFWLLDEEPGE